MCMFNVDDLLYCGRLFRRLRTVTYEMDSTQQRSSLILPMISASFSIFTLTDYLALLSRTTPESLTLVRSLPYALEVSVVSMNTSGEPTVKSLVLPGPACSRVSISKDIHQPSFLTDPGTHLGLDPLDVLLQNWRSHNENLCRSYW